MNNLVWIEQKPYQNSVIIDGREIKLFFTNTHLDVLIVLSESGYYVFERIFCNPNPRERKENKQAIEQNCKNFLKT